MTSETTTVGKQIVMTEKSSGDKMILVSSTQGQDKVMMREDNLKVPAEISVMTNQIHPDTVINDHNLSSQWWSIHVSRVVVIIISMIINNFIAPHRSINQFKHLVLVRDHSIFHSGKSRRKYQCNLKHASEKVLGKKLKNKHAVHEKRNRSGDKRIFPQKNTRSRLCAYCRSS